MPPDALAKSMAHCQRVTRRAKSSFPLAFRLLPRAKRHAMTHLYAFFRLSDDLVDEPGELETKIAALGSWRVQLDDAYYGQFTHPIHAALHDSLHRYAIPLEYLHDVLDGMAMDLQPQPFATFTELHTYCYRVASAVGLSCIPIWGLRTGVTFEDAKPASIAAGVAFQLTNILRDLAEDSARGRVYLPEEDLVRFGISPTSWQADGAKYREFMQFQAARAQEYYREAEELKAMLTPEGRAIYTAMCGLYSRLLQTIEQQNFDVFTQRIRLTSRAKLSILLRAWWGA
jgi:15-cis-phytoene synthase